jgi:hypothetical protein
MVLTAYLIDTIADAPFAAPTDTDGMVSLREAITAANTNAAFGDAAAGASGADMINFAADLVGQTITLGGVELSITEDLSISGLGASGLTISGGNASRVFSIDSEATVELSGATIADGSTADVDSGGAVHNSGTMTVSDCVFTDNSAEYYAGGAFYNLGSLTIINSTLRANGANLGGGVYNIGTLEVHGSTLSANTAETNGAGIYTEDGGAAIVRGTEFIDNVSGSAGGAIDNSGGFGANNPGSLDIADSTFIGNSASSGAGIWNEGPAIIADCTFSDNHVRNWGGAVANNIGTMLIFNSSFTDNSAGAFSGAIDNSFGGTLHLEGSLIQGNHAGREGGGIEQYFGTMTIANSTISGNSSNGTGGGVWNLGAMEITNSTIVLNRTDADGNGSGPGGGLYHQSNSSYPDVLLNNTIVAGNLAGATGGASPDDVFGNLDLASARNLIGDAATGGGLTHGENGNIVGNSGAGTIDLASVINTNLADNGGPTLTHALVEGSLAIDAGDNSLAVDSNGDPLPYDQRGEGFARVINAAVDIGAFEMPLPPLPVVVDVKPGSDPNSINLASQGLISIAIFTTDDFDAADVNVSSIVWADAHVAQKNNGSYFSALEDVDGDGDLDLVVHFRLAETNLLDSYEELLRGDLADGTLDSYHHSVDVALGGLTNDGATFRGADSVDLFLTGKNLRDFRTRLGI